MNNNDRRFFAERPLPQFEVDPKMLRRRTRRDVLWLGAGTVAALERFRSLLSLALRIDDDVAESLCSPNRKVQAYTKSL